jgi:hypothetical protein
MPCNATAPSADIHDELSRERDASAIQSLAMPFPLRSTPERLFRLLVLVILRRMWAAGFLQEFFERLLR